MDALYGVGSVNPGTSLAGGFGVMPGVGVAGNRATGGVAGLGGTDQVFAACFSAMQQQMMMQMLQMLMVLMKGAKNGGGAQGITGGGGAAAGGGGAAGATGGTGATGGAPANTPANATKDQGEIKGYIKEAAAAYGADPNVLSEIARRESNYDANAVNDWDSNAKKGTPSKGMFQFIEPTFNSMAPKAKAANPKAWEGLGELNWMDWRQQALTTAWAITHGMGSHWATYQAAGGK